eukprot:6236926-Amphidinium_carterae.1
MDIDKLHWSTTKWKRVVIKEANKSLKVEHNQRNTHCNIHHAAKMPGVVHDTWGTCWARWRSWHCRR